MTHPARKPRPEEETPQPKKLSRIQVRNRRKIMNAALEVFSSHGYRGATLDQIATEAGLSKPNILYYFEGKEAIHVELLNALMFNWLAPLHKMGPGGDPMTEVLTYVRRKMEMSRQYPRESRLFANEVLQGAPRMGPHLETGLKPLFDEKCAVLADWMAQGKLAKTDPGQLLMSIWAVTQHYADFDAQVNVLIADADAGWKAANSHVDLMFRKLLTP
ncbi:TetR family transcriptional regulator C-terminal domain-containing protein [Pseudoprimorskyibacter insulae]|uniref:HTH-type transcriptional regulator RutR n=1 Tax=Pseudoprimorskyibacter insulae TaxID=1695997 RepID=A0A2R8B0V2_9RHOB|nr:TetR family transcriptional regulator C-terminal domain-containing protein [Pseudoprimorskyibacter insulae]SPF81891.1 HTH-type transcriptional regulator RutR [Pseudoprimorskyibacter insulae]